MLGELLKSKRLWIVVITAAAHLLAKYQVSLSDNTIDALADQLILAAGAASIVYTKVHDSKKAPNA